MSGRSFNRFGVESGVKKQPTTQLEVKTLLNQIQRFVGFVYHSVCLRGVGTSRRVEVRIHPHRGIRGKCSTCQQPCPGYDQLAERRWLFVPLWGIVVHFFYPPRRVTCPTHGVGVEHIPWRHVFNSTELRNNPMFAGIYRSQRNNLLTLC